MIVFNRLLIFWFIDIMYNIHPYVVERPRYFDLNKVDSDPKAQTVSG
jgi:hypothetical protein